MRTIPFALGPALLAALLAACDATPAPAPSAAANSSTAVATPAPPAGPTVPDDALPAAVTAAGHPDSGSAAPAQCPDADFDAFLKRFEASADAQRAASTDPLTMSRIDPDAQPEPAPVTRQVAKAEVKFPVLAAAATRTSEGAALRVQDTLAKTQRVVVVSRPDSGAQMRFVFDATPCWTLTAVHDESM